MEASHDPAPDDLDEGQLARTGRTMRGQHPSVVGDHNGSGLRRFVVSPAHEPNDVAIHFGSPLAGSQSILEAQLLHHQSNHTSPEHDLSCLTMAPARSAHSFDHSTAGPASPLPEEDFVDLGDVGLEALDYLVSNPSNLDLVTTKSWPDSAMAVEQTTVVKNVLLPAPPESVAESPPDLYRELYPNAAYRRLHAQLHDNIVEAARNIAITRQGTPDLAPASLPRKQPQHSTSVSDRQRTLPVSPRGQKMPMDARITHRRLVELWQNYLDEIAPWLDMFDDTKHWQTTVAQMARRVDGLQYSLLALSARQLERRSPGKSYTESLGLYQEAIRLVTVQIPSLSTEIIAACILLSVLEMMSSSPRAWAKHLDGCAILFEAAGVSGAAEGVRQTLFWTFARMDVYNAFISDTVTNLPTNRWYVSADSMAAAAHYFKGRSGSGSYANYCIFLCAGVVNMLWGKDTKWARSDHDRSRTFILRWKALYDLLEGWYNDRPEDMKPLMDVPPSRDDTHSPFNTILYSTPPGISGNQVYHASMILLLQDKPKEIRPPKSHKSMLWHARQICGIALSNSDHGALINALQPIWIAGKLMSHHSEHDALLRFLKRLEAETGWATSWRAEDLKEFWGVVGGDDDEEDEGKETP